MMKPGGTHKVTITSITEEKVTGTVDLIVGDNSIKGKFEANDCPRNNKIMAHFIKNLIVISFAFLFLPCLLVGCANAQKADVLTDEAVLRTIEKLRGGDWQQDEICVKRLKENESAKIVVVGVKDEKSVCDFDGAFVGSDYFEHGKLDWTKNALHLLGWEKANRQGREMLAKLWVEKVLFAFSAKSNQTFQAVPMDNDEIKVIVSLQFPPGVTSRNAPKIFVFDKDGNMSPQGNY